MEKSRSVGESPEDRGVSNDLTLEEDHYSERLASVNEDNSVVATEDVCNAHGALLVKKGARISEAVSKRILKHKLFKPLEEQVKLDKELDATSLSKHSDELFKKYPDLNTLNKSLRFGPVWESIIREYQLPAVLWQKLTVMQHQLPQDYEKSIFCAWLAVLVGWDMKLTDDELKALYIAGLAHDAGLLHIDPAILNKKGPLEPAEWRAIKSHVIVGKLMVENIQGLSRDVAQAILDHHERCDGTGYPAQKSDRHLKTLGLIVGIADSLQAVRVKQFEAVGRNLIDALPYLRMNAYTYSYRVYKSMRNILHRSGLKPTAFKPENDASSFLKDISQRSKKLKMTMEQLIKLQEILTDAAISMRGKDLLRALERVSEMVFSSGLIQEEFVGWLQTLDDTPDQTVMGELGEVELMLNELKWQLNNLLHALNSFCEHGAPDSEDECIVVKEITNILLANMP